MDRPAVIICVDGCSPGCLRDAETPNIDRLAKAGKAIVGKAVMPSVTNVNNASILTGTFPAAHGITANYYIDPGTGQGVFMETEEFLLAPTIFERLASKGKTSGLVTTKDKLRTLLGRFATISVSAENPPPWLVGALGPPPGIYTAAVNVWLLRAAAHVMTTRPDLHFLYVATSDYVMHTYDPAHDESQRYMNTLDRQVGELADLMNDRFNLLITADHGMNTKRCGLDLEKTLRNRGSQGRLVPIIQDRHVVHHQNLGGAAYVYLECMEALPEVTGILSETPGVEAVFSREAAAMEMYLHPRRIGDLMVVADRETVFGYLPEEKVPLQMRSHGSFHEAEVPIVAYGQNLEGASIQYNKDAARVLLPAYFADDECKRGSVQ